MTREEEKKSKAEKSDDDKTKEGLVAARNKVSIVGRLIEHPGNEDPEAEGACPICVARTRSRKSARKPLKVRVVSANPDSEQEVLNESAKVPDESNTPADQSDMKES